VRSKYIYVVRRLRVNNGGVRGKSSSGLGIVIRLWNERTGVRMPVGDVLQTASGAHPTCTPLVTVYQTCSEVPSADVISSKTNP
jgi:hypothetical protein